MTRPRQSYDGVALTAPVSIPYERYSIQTAHWWIARALKASLDSAGLKPGDLDGFSVASFTLFPDTAVGLTQHLGLSPRWLDHIPMGGASGVVALSNVAACFIGEIVAALGDEDENVRWLASSTLASMNDERVVAAVRAFAARTTSPAVLETALKLLAV